MPSKRQRAQRNASRVASVEVFKKRRLEASPLLNSEQLNTDDDKLSTIDTSDDESDSAETWFWNESANETDSDSEEESCNNVDEKHLEEEQPRMEQAVSPKIEVEIESERRTNSSRGYGKGSRSTQMLHNKSARDFFLILFIFNVYLQPCDYDRLFPLSFFILQTPDQRLPFFFSISVLSCCLSCIVFSQPLDYLPF